MDTGRQWEGHNAERQRMKRIQPYRRSNVECSEYDEFEDMEHYEFDHGKHRRINYRDEQVSDCEECQSCPEVSVAAVTEHDLESEIQKLWLKIVEWVGTVREIDLLHLNVSLNGTVI